ncbi:alpha/beta-hydrolase N-terminal domain-containing protein [Rhodococcus aetherivorans]
MRRRSRGRGRRGAPPAARGSARPGAARPAALVVAAGALGWAVLAAAQWQDALRASMGRPPAGPAHWIVVCSCAP